MAATPFVPGTQPARPDVGALVGQVPTAQPAGPNAEEVSRSVMGRIRELIAGVEALATEYPSAAESARGIKQGLVDMMVEIVGSISAPESPAPRVLG